MGKSRILSQIDLVCYLSCINLIIYLFSVIKLNLKSSQFSPGSKFHLRVAERLSSVPWLTFDVIVAWKPCVNPPTDICPSSIASWFSQAGYSVSTCRVKFQRRTFYNVNMPCYDEEKLEELLEWTGMLLLGCDL